MNWWTKFTKKQRYFAEPKKIKIILEHLDIVNINGDVIRLKQLFLNLVDNAIKYTRPRGPGNPIFDKRRQWRCCYSQRQRLWYPSKNQGKIFERFYRVERNDENIEDEGGSGLGLSIAKWITEAHHGTIEVKSREGKRQHIYRTIACVVEAKVLLFIFLLKCFFVQLTVQLADITA